MKAWKNIALSTAIAWSAPFCSGNSLRNDKLEQHHQKGITTEAIKDTLIREEPSISELEIEVLSKELEGTPFCLKRGIIEGTFWNLLGYSQTENIIKEYNNFPDSLDFKSEQCYTLEDTIRFPMIYPELKDYFPKKIEQLRKNPVFEKYKGKRTEHLLIVSQCENGKNALGYYEKGNLKLATYVSIGTTWRKTITGNYPLIHDQIFRRSRTYNNEPMPYSFQVKGNYFLHQGTSDGSPISHWCIRVPGLYQKWLYEHLPNSKKGNDKKINPAEIILEGLYVPTLKKITIPTLPKNQVSTKPTDSLFLDL